MNPFDSCSEQYRKFRPDYPAPLIDFIDGITNGLIVDVGAGTGKASAPFVSRGRHVVSIEPSLAMIREGVRAYSALHYVCSTGEQLPLRSESATMVICAQAFHWLNVSGALHEFARVLQPAGHVCLFWNTRDDRYPAAALFEELIHKWNPEHVLAYRRRDWGDRINESGLFQRVAQRTYRQTAEMTIDDWVGLSRSISYIQSIGAENVAKFEHELRQGLALLADIHCVYATELWWAVK